MGLISWGQREAQWFYAASHASASSPQATRGISTPPCCPGGRFGRLTALFFDFSDDSDRAADLEVFAHPNRISNNLFSYDSKMKCHGLFRVFHLDIDAKHEKQPASDPWHFQREPLFSRRSALTFSRAADFI